jgi:hypothetical protein
MRRDEYCRLHAACLAMAKQATEPKMRDRWSAMADAWLERATELHEVSSDGVGGQASFGHPEPPSTGAPARGPGAEVR